MNNLLLILLLSTMSTFLLADNVKPDPCPSPQECISKISRVLDIDARPGQYPSQAEQAIIAKLLSFGSEGIPFIVSLLEHKDPLIARIGAVALRKAEKISPTYLPAIIKGLDNEVSWLAPALAKVGTPEASAIAVERYLKSKSAPHNQEAYAIKLLGMKALPHIIEAIKCKSNCVSNRFYLLGSVLSDFKSGKDEIATQLINIAKDNTQNHEIRGGSLEVISFLGVDAKNTEGDILALKDSYKELSYFANQVLIGIKSKHAAIVLAEGLGTEESLWVLRDIAELGVNGKSAGERITTLLDKPDPQTQLYAARTLGYIEYELAALKLIELLNKGIDVPISMVSAESLGRMKSAISLPALREAAKHHWHPAVRDTAQKAMQTISSKNIDTQLLNSKNFAFDYFSFQQLDIAACESTQLKQKSEPLSQKLYQTNARENLEALAYQSVILSYGAGDEDEQLAEDPEGIIEVNDHNMVENKHHVTQVPQMALRADDGWFAGSDRGEWGGELVFISDNGSEPQYIMKENIEDIYFTTGNYIVVTGLAHLSMNSGMIFKLQRGENGQWISIPWINLPGAPKTSWFVETGELLINTYGGGSLLLSVDGTFRMAECSNG